MLIHNKTQSPFFCNQFLTQKLYSAWEVCCTIFNMNVNEEKKSIDKFP